ncbi:primosomal protein [Mycobacterium sp. PDNC021]|uniref:protein export chaperone SatS n=1 Tax=Mycobacterium sp. PDNC021 TaxID=3391399 RepID=UPI003AAE6FAA
MAADIVPVRLGLTHGDLYTLWAPLWRDSDDEWEAFLGDDDALFGFDSVADLAAFVRTNTDNDLADHPKWQALGEANAHRLNPDESHLHDLVGVPELVAEKPTDESVTSLRRTLQVVGALGSVCDLIAVAKFFNGNPVLSTLGGGAEAYSGRAGRKRWADIEAAVGRSWDHVLDAIDELVTTPEVDATAAAKAQAELDEPAPEPEEDELDEAEAAAEDSEDEVIEGEVDTDSEEAALTVQAERQLLGSDEDFWERVGIDPIRIMTKGGTFYTLRCYYNDQPRFLGRNGRISVFGSERALARYLADEHESDLSSFEAYADIRTAATDGSLQIRVTEDNVYVLSGLSDDISDGPDAVDREQLDLAIEFARDVCDYADDGTADKALTTSQPLGKFVGHVLEPETVGAPSKPYAEAVAQWETLERFVESRLRQE